MHDHPERRYEGTETKEDESLYATETRTTTATSLDEKTRPRSHSQSQSHGDSRTGLKTIDESSYGYNAEEDIAPLDQPASIQAITDREPFQVLARHISGISQTGAGPALDPPPDGGWEAWGVVAGAWFVLFVGFGIITSFGQFAEYYINNQLANHTRSEIARIGSFSCFSVFFLSIFSGRWFDSHGARAIVISGTIISTTALFCLAFCKVYYQFLLAHLLFGIGCAFLYSPCTAVVAHWFLKRRATAVGIILCGSGLGGVIFPIVLSSLFPRLGFRKTVLVLAGMAGFLFLPSWFTVRARLPPKQSIPWSHAGRPWKETKYSVYVAGVALIWLNYFTPFFFANDFAANNKVPKHIATYTVTFLQAGSFFGRALSGPCAERWGAIETFVVSGVLSGIIILALWTTAAVGTAGTIVGAFLYGLFSGAVIALVAACCAQLSPVREFGLRLGMMWSVAALPLLAGPQVSGIIIQKEGKYTGASIFGGITIIAGSLLTFAPVFWRRWRTRRGKSQQENEEDKIVA